MKIGTEEQVLQAREGYGQKVLLVEDNLVNQFVTSQYLDSLKFKADVANNGKEALDLAQKHQYAVILMDVRMPVMDGLEATQSIRALERTSTPIIALTATDTEVDKQKCLNAGMNDFLIKPFTVKDLFKKLMKYIPEAFDLIMPPQVEISVTGPETTKKLIDKDWILKLYQILPDAHKRQKMFDLFFTDSEKILKELVLKLNMGENEDLGHLAHKFKGQCGHMGAVGLVELCKKIEVMETEDMNVQKEKLQSILQNMETTYRTTKKDLLEILLDLDKVKA